MRRLSSEHRSLLQTNPLFSKVIFEFNDGWFELIYDLGMKILGYCNAKKIELPQIRQIKEKFGTLRFYYIDKSNNEQIREWVRDAESRSEFICEKCGELGELRVDNGRWGVVCSNHSSPTSLSLSEYQEMRAKAEQEARKCSICGIGGAEIYWNGTCTVNLCDQHKENYSLLSQYLSEKKATDL